MRRSALAASAVWLLLAAAPGSAGLLPRPFATDRLEAVNRQLAGRVVDFTANHGCDRRLVSPALGVKRDVYVYLPPGYDGATQFPGMLFLHGAAQDEKSFLNIVPVFDQAIRAGTLPPMVIAAPDGSVKGHRTLSGSGSFYLNSDAGRFGDYVVFDVWGFVRRNYAVRPERDAHVIAGVSMGGFGAYNLGFHHRAEFGHLAGIYPPLDLRYADCHGRYFPNYDPACNSYKDPLRRNRVVGIFFGVVPIRTGRLFGDLVNPGGDLTGFLAGENPVEMLDRYDIRPGEFDLFVGYGTKDEFNIDAHIEHFLAVACRRGIRPDMAVIPGGRHNRSTALALFPALSRWLTAGVGRDAPAGYDPASGGPARVIPLFAVRQPLLVPTFPATTQP